MDIVTAAQFDKDIREGLSKIEVRCGFEAEFASTIERRKIPSILKHFLADPTTALRQGDEDVELQSGAVKGISWSDSYGASHDSDYTKWSVEKDGSIPTDRDHHEQVEVVTPILTLPEFHKALKSVLAMISAETPVGPRGMSLGKTAKTTGLHMTFSIKDINPANIDPLKLAVFVGESHIGADLDRMGTEFASPALGILSRAVRMLPQDQVNDFVNAYVDNTEDERFNPIVSHLRAKLMSSEKFMSLNMSKRSKGIIEFRLPGGAGYEHKYDILSRTADRFAYAFFAAANPEMYKEYYKKKLTRLTLKAIEAHRESLKTSNGLDGDALNTFVRTVGGKDYLVATHGTSAIDEPALAFLLTPTGDGAFLVAPHSSMPAGSSVEFLSRAGRVTLTVPTGRVGVLCSAKYTASNDLTLAAAQLLDRFALPTKVADKTNAEHYVFARQGTRSAAATSRILAMESNPDLPESVASYVRNDVDEAVREAPGQLVDILGHTDSFSDAAKIVSSFRETIQAGLSNSTLTVSQVLVDPTCPDMFDLQMSVSRSAPEVAKYISSAEFVTAMGQFNLTTGEVDSRTLSGWSSFARRPFFQKIMVHQLIARWFVPTAAEHPGVILACPNLDDSQSAYMAEIIRNLSDPALATVVGFFNSSVRSVAGSLGAGLDRIFEINRDNNYIAVVITAVLNTLPDAPPVPAEIPADYDIRSAPEGTYPNIYTPATKLLSGCSRINVDIILTNRPNTEATALDILEQPVVRHATIDPTKIFSDGNCEITSPRWLKFLGDYFIKNGKKFLAETQYKETSAEALARLYVKLVGDGVYAKLPAFIDKEAAGKTVLPTILAAFNPDQDFRLSYAEAVRDAGDKMLRVVPTVKTELYNKLLATKSILGHKAAMYFTPAAVAGTIAIGYKEHKEEALGNGSAMYLYQAAFSIRPFWHADHYVTFTKALFDLTGITPDSVPKCPVFDVLASIFVHQQGVGSEDWESAYSDPSVVAWATTYTRSTTLENSPEAKAKKHSAIKYPKVTASLAAVAPVAIPDDVPAAVRLTPKQMAAFFGSPSGEEPPADVRNTPGWSAQRILLLNLSSYTVEQLVEFLSCPQGANHQDKFCAVVAQTLFWPIAGDETKVYAQGLTVNALLAFKQLGELNIVRSYFMYVIQSKQQADMKTAFGAGRALDAGTAQGVFNTLVDMVVRNKRVKLKPTVKGYIPGDLNEIMGHCVATGVLSVDTFCSAAFVDLCNFLVTSGTAKSVTCYKWLNSVYSKLLPTGGKFAAIIDTAVKESLRGQSYLDLASFKRANYPIAVQD